MKRVFVDTGGFFANLVSTDPAYERARALFVQAEEDGWQLFTTNAVVIETHALLVNRSRNGRAVALGFLDSIEAGLCRVERVTRQDEGRAIRPVRSHADKDYSLCDALSFVVMERLRIHEAIAFDRHFREYGRLAIL